MIQVRGRISQFIQEEGKVAGRQREVKQNNDKICPLQIKTFLLHNDG